MGDRGYFAKNLVWLRKKERYTQEKLAYLMAFSRSRLGGYEEGRNEPDIAALIGISEFFGVSIDDLLKKELWGS